MSSITTFIIDGDSSERLWASRLMEVVCILALSLFLALYNADIVIEMPKFSKIYLGGVIAVSMFSRILEIYVVHIWGADDLRKEKIHMSNIA
jgi:hypothetical protein